MTFESSIKIFDVAITKIFDSADMFFDSAGFDAAAVMTFDSDNKIFDSDNMIFDSDNMDFDSDNMKFDLRIARKFDPSVPRNLTPASQEIRPRRPKKFDPSVPRNSTPASQEIRPRF
jgi:hypothetical protein